MPNICPVCNETFQYTVQLQKHLQTHKDYKPLQCDHPGCSYCTSHLGSLNTHKKIHDSTSMLECDHPDCAYRTVRPFCLVNHKRTHNPDTLLRCDYNGCQFRTAHQSYLTAHKRMHNIESMFQCDQPNCTYRTAHANLLARHKKTHNPESMLKCDYPGCSYRTVQNSNLTTHKRSHNPETMLRCDYPGCSYRSAQPGNLTAHRRTHNPDSLLQCDFPNCAYRTSHPGNLAAHKRIHNPDALLQCDHPGCSYRTLHLITLNKHRIRMHSLPQPAFLTTPTLPLSHSPILPNLLTSTPVQQYEVKQEPQERSGSPLLNPLKRKLDDDGPILRNPANPSESMMHLAERPTDQITVTRWGDLTADSITRRRINDEVRQWLRDEGRHTVRFAELLHVMYPIDDGPERGLSVFAKRDLPPCTVLGPYSGILHDELRSNSLSAERRKAGTNNVHRYTFQTRSEQRLVSAFSSGNVLSLINTVALPGHEPLPGKRNNVSAIVVGRNITFYLTNTFIPEGEELFVDYGPDYEAEPNAKRLKQEAVSRSPSPQAPTPTVD